MPGEPPPDHELEHRLARRDERAHRVVAALQAQIARVEPVRPDGDEGLRGEPLLLGERAARRLLARLIRVEGEDHLAEARGVGVVDVAEHPADDLDVVDAEARAAGGDRGRDAREVAGHHIRVALDDHDLLVLGDVAAGEVEPVEHLALVVDRRLGGVEVLRPLVLLVVEQLAGAEPDGLAGDVADRPDQPAAEAVVVVAAVAGAEQARPSSARAR